MFVHEAVVNQNPAAFGADRMVGARFDPGYLRPYFHPDTGERVVTVTNGVKFNAQTGQYEPRKKTYRISDLQARGINSPVFNATALSKEQWIEMDRVALKAARYRMRAWDDLAASNTYGGFNGMAKSILEHETVSDVGQAVVDMDGLTESARQFSPTWQLEGIPLEITHCDFWLPQRRLLQSRAGGEPLSMMNVEMAGQRVGEVVEKRTIGNMSTIEYGGNSTQVGGYGRTSKVYGYLNFTGRSIKTNLTTPTGSNPEATVADVLAMRQTLYNNKFYGPFMLYHSTDWDTYLDNDYARLGGDNASLTLRDRLKRIEGVTDVRRLDMLFAEAPQTNPYWTSSTIGTTGQLVYRGPGGEELVSGSSGSGYSNGNNPFTLVMVSMNQQTARAVIGMGLTTLQWETVGGMKLNFKTMCIYVPQIRADFYGNTGILHATVA